VFALLAAGVCPACEQAAALASASSSAPSACC
jgi:hypothetical protein